jgi:hypothetical protein
MVNRHLRRSDYRDEYCDGDFWRRKAENSHDLLSITITSF